MPILLDTHAWVWWVPEDRRLSKRAAAAIQATSRGEDGVWVSTISIWEVAKKVEKKQLVLDRPLRQWLEQATTVPGLFLAELSTAILLDSCELQQPFHGNPADQMIDCRLGPPPRRHSDHQGSKAAILSARADCLVGRRSMAPGHLMGFSLSASVHS